MRNGSYEQQTVQQVIDRIPGSARTLRAYGIDPTSRLTIAQAAAATSTSTDELLAMIEHRARRATQQTPGAQRRSGRELVEEHDEEFDLVV
jgi:protein-tyrosine-phosphatase